MNTRTPPEVKVLTLVHQFIEMLPPVDKAEILSELALVEKVHIPGTNFQMVPTEPHLWALIISANGRNWCLLAHWDAQQAGSSFVCTHVFARGSGYIPEIEISRALRFYQQYKSQGGV